MKFLSNSCVLYHKITAKYSKFVPPSSDAAFQSIEKLREFVSSKNRLLVLTGAGISTESGIPDYRSEGVGLYARTDRRPMTYQDFVKSSLNRQRYWARNFCGWPTFARFEPNESHFVLKSWQNLGLVQCLVTQNVDALHRKAGSDDVVELHGCTHRVVCLSCQKYVHVPYSPEQALKSKR